MDLNSALRGVETNAKERKGISEVRSIPDNEIERMIAKRCGIGDLHYDDVWSVVGKLVTVDGISSESLLKHSEFFNQYIASDSDSMKNITVANIIERREEKYPDQTGIHIKSDTPGDCFSDEVYNNLPEHLKEICFQVDERRKRDVLLIGMLTALSAAFSRYRFYHGADNDVKEYSPHLLSLVVAAAGSGKGLTRYGNTLVGAITQQANLMQANALRNYKLALSDFKKQLKEVEKGNKKIETIEEPRKPIKYCFAMSASDTTQAALVEKLRDNPIGGFAYDSEVDTLIQGNQNKDFGGFSDIIRKVFHHEPLARQRKGEGESYIVENPRLAIMLSGTHDQLKKLIPSEYNGLFSRLWYYTIPPTFMEYRSGKQQRDLIGEMCQGLQRDILKRSDLWSDELHYLEFTAQQELDLFSAMQDKRDLEEKYGGDIGASCLRMALIVKRIAATLSGFEGVGSSVVPDHCWRVAISLLPAIKSHCIHALSIVRQNQGKKNIDRDEYNRLKKEGKNDTEAAKLLGISRPTLARAKEAWA
ncbi:DUF3987 domain-containing protein [Pollutibacter soli]|uniref:DUF3987 domain-containing protein n=1 Tax=Pollutibacter soli TaxID=3034157 RepID=UPI003013D65B